MSCKWEKESLDERANMLCTPIQHRDHNNQLTNWLKCGKYDATERWRRWSEWVQWSFEGCKIPYVLQKFSSHLLAALMQEGKEKNDESVVRYLKAHIDAPAEVHLYHWYLYYVPDARGIKDATRATADNERSMILANTFFFLEQGPRTEISTLADALL